MECPKCQGRVVKEWVADALEEEYQLRCVNCGWIGRDPHACCCSRPVLPESCS